MRRIETTSRAKINLFLHVGRRRDDGFHELETVFQEIDLADTVSVEQASRTSIECDDPAIPTDASNLAWQAWSALADRFAIPPVRITIAKRIPAGGGLAGGSSNAAAVLNALAEMYALPVSRADLAAVALDLGSDVPFFLEGGTAYATGRGEQLQPLAGAIDVPILLVLPGEPVSTPRAFAMLAEDREATGTAPLEFIGVDQTRRLTGSVTKMVAATRNDLEASATKIAPSIARAVDDLRAAGAVAVRMSGSGSTVWAVFEDVRALARAEGGLERRWETRRVRPYSRG